MAKEQRKYDMEYIIQAVKLAKEIGGAKAAAELGIPENTLYAWMKAERGTAGHRRFPVYRAAQKKRHGHNRNQSKRRETLRVCHI